jgi:hypothetical protein
LTEVTATPLGGTVGLGTPRTDLEGEMMRGLMNGMWSLMTAGLLVSPLSAAELSGWALLPAATYSPGPTSGQFASSAYTAHPLPLVNQQPVQGFSAVLHGPTEGSYYVMADNGFGSKANSPDTLLRVYSMRPNFKSFNGSAVTGAGTVTPVDFQTGAALASFNSNSFITLHDPDNRLGFTRISDGTFYPYSGSGPGNSSIPVDSAITSGRLLTGADFDIESFQRDHNGNLWFGEEFGPFLIKTDASGKVLRSEIPLAGVQSPDNPYLSGTSNLGRSRGYEGMAISRSGKTLYPLLEGTVTGDPTKSLRINEFDVDSETYTGRKWLYLLESVGTAIGDMTAVNESQFIVIERNGDTATTPGGNPFKKLFLIDLNQTDSQGFVQKTELVDLMNLADPHDLNGDGNTVFTFPYVTIEDVLILNSRTLLVMNDNNYPGGGGRGNYADENEFLMIRLDQPLAIPEPSTVALGACGLVAVLVNRLRSSRKS